MENIKGTLDALAEMFTTRMSTFEQDLLKLSPAPNTSASALARDFERFRSFVLSSFADIQGQISLLSTECDTLEMRSRRKMLLLHGVPEREDENTVDVVTDVLKSQVHLKHFEASGLSRAHRMGRAGERPRPVVVKFRSCEMRDEAWFGKTSLKGSGVTISEFLTSRRHRLFKAVRMRLGVSKCWTREGRIVGLDQKGKRHIVSSLGDLDRLCPPEELHSEQPLQAAALRSKEPGLAKGRMPSARRGRGLPTAKQ